MLPQNNPDRIGVVFDDHRLSPSRLCSKTCGEPADRQSRIALLSSRLW